MKIAVGIISLFLGLLVLLQSCAVATTAGLVDNAAIGGAGAVGLLVGLLFFVGGAFAFALPLVAAIILFVAGLFAFIVSGEFGDMGIWGGVALGLAALEALAWRSARKKQQAGVEVRS